MRLLRTRTRTDPAAILLLLCFAAGLAACSTVDWGRVLDAITTPQEPSPDGTELTADGYFLVPTPSGGSVRMDRYSFCSRFRDARCAP